MNIETRSGSEFRAQGRVLSGVVLRYGDISPDFAERFVPGSLAPLPDVPLNLQHDRAMVVLPPGRFVLADSERALEIRAELPASSAALALVKRGALNGFSVEFLLPAARSRDAGNVQSDRARAAGRDRFSRFSRAIPILRPRCVVVAVVVAASGHAYRLWKGDEHAIVWARTDCTTIVIEPGVLDRAIKGAPRELAMMFWQSWEITGKPSRPRGTALSSTGILQKALKWTSACQLLNRVKN